LEQKCTSHGTELAHLQAQLDDKTRALVWQMQQHDGTLRTLRTLHDDQFSKFEQSHSIEILKLKSEHDDTLSTCKQSHSIEVRDLKTHHASTEARSDVRAEQKLQAQHEAFLSEQRAQHAAHQLALFEQHSRAVDRIYAAVLCHHGVGQAHHQSFLRFGRQGCLNHRQDAALQRT
jgi:tRNA U55 pseudouridine synthase TruB